MTTTLHSPAGVAASPAAAGPATGAGVMTKLGGVCLALGPTLFAIGSVTAPHQEEMTKDSYVSSLVDHPFQAAVSANFLHYSWFFWTFGLLAATALVARGVRGRTLTSVSAVVGSIGAIQISGLLLVDFFVIKLGTDYSIATAVDVESHLGTSVTIWLFSAQVLALLPPLLVFAGLGRARVIPWKLVPLPIVGYAAVAVPLPVVVALIIALASWLPAYVAAYRLVTGTTRRLAAAS